jgi:hypothetical protein
VATESALPDRGQPFTLSGVPAFETMRKECIPFVGSRTNRFVFSGLGNAAAETSPDKEDSP